MIKWFPQYIFKVYSSFAFVSYYSSIVIFTSLFSKIKFTTHFTMRYLFSSFSKITLDLLRSIINKHRDSENILCFIIFIESSENICVCLVLTHPDCSLFCESRNYVKIWRTYHIVKCVVFIFKKLNWKFLFLKHECFN